MMGFGLIWIVLIIGGIAIVLIIGGIAYVLGWRSNFFRAQRPVQTHNAPFEILKGRYARGEISRAEYDEMRRDLES